MYRSVSPSTGSRSWAYPGKYSTASQERWRPSQWRMARLRWAGSPSHTSVAFCPPRKAPQLAQGADEAVGVIGVVLMVEGHGRAAAQGPKAQGGGHRRPLPFEVVEDDRSVAARRPGATGDR